MLTDLYKSGARSICGVKMPDGLVSNQKFDEPIITPSTKADFGHDEDISKSDILKKYFINWSVWRSWKNYP